MNLFCRPLGNKKTGQWGKKIETSFLENVAVQHMFVYIALQQTANSPRW
jgi:hypothetical protein